MDIIAAERIYVRILSKIGKYQGQIIAIDPDSGDYYIGLSTIDACDLARKKHPDKRFYLKRIGAKATFVVGSL
jgi:hypothetical protein